MAAAKHSRTLIEMDNEGKDSWRFVAQTKVLLLSAAVKPQCFTNFTEEQPEIKSVVS